MGSSQNIADYFVVTGLEISSGLEPDKLSGDNLHCSPLDRPYKAKVLGHYPETVPGNPFDHEAVCMLCHPRGVKFRTQHEARPASFHTFLITREDGSRIYGSVLTFYEQVDDSGICTAMKMLQDMHMAELDNAQSHTLYSHLPTSVYKRSPRLSAKHAGRSYDMKKDTLYVTRTICLISVLPLVNTFERYLSWLYEILMGQCTSTLPLDSYVYNLIYEVPLPPPGRSMRLKCSGDALVCQRPGATELPLFDYSLKQLFDLLGAESVMNIFTSLLLEHQVLLYSTDYQRLMLVAEGINVLMFPFSWPHVYVPILPASMMHFLDAPVPFVMGLSHISDEDTLNDLSSRANMCFVNIDTACVELPEDLPEFPYKSQLIQDSNFWISNQPRNNSSGDHNSQRLQNQHHHGNLNQRDSGFRESFIGYEDPANVDVSKSDSMWSLPNKMDILQQSEAMAKITALAKKTGVITSLDDISETFAKVSTGQHIKDTTTSSPRSKLQALSEHDKDLITNNIIREVFLHYFLQIFNSYEHFVIQPPPDIDMETWLCNRESMQNFDKAAFLGDQPEGHLPFLSAFIETQMFTSFTDNKILAQWEEKDPNLELFEQRLQSYKDEYGDRRMKVYNRNTMANEGESLIMKRALNVDMMAPHPHSLEGATCTAFTPGIMPMLNSQILNTPPKSSNRRDGEDMSSLLKRKSRHSLHSEHLQLQMSTVQKQKFLIEQRSKGPKHKLSDINNAHMAQTNWKFVETLLKEVKSKTKRMLVEKMGQEAFELGHRESVHVGVEENTLIASMCDLLERIWSHGLQNKQGKSALWWHLLSYQEKEHYKKRGTKTENLDPALLTPDLKDAHDVSGSSRGGGGTGSDDDNMSGMQTWPVRRHRRKPSRDRDTVPSINPLPVSVYADLQHIQQITDLRTDVGCARAWVRLALEKKLLSVHFKELLRNAALLKELYKRYAFLRCEDEREQFLFHLLSLNAVDFHCFTNTFTNITIPYRVFIFPRQKVSGSTTTANCWFSLAGHLRETHKVSIPKNTLDIPLQHKSIGILTTMRIGHDNAGMSPKWMVEHVLVRNEVTGHTYRFPCGKSLGKGVDDGALERLLIAEPVPVSTDSSELSDSCRTPPRCRSPSMPRRSHEPKLQMTDIQEMLGDSVNNLVKHFYKPERERGSMTALLCGEYGLVYCMEHVFQFGFKTSKLFGKRYVWDFIEKVQEYFDNLLNGTEHCRIEGEVRRVIENYCHVVSQIGQASESVGKDGRFQIFILIGTRDHILPRWISIMSRTPEVYSVYEEKSFMRDKNLLRYVIQLLDSLNEFDVHLEKSLIKGIQL